jgi:NADP-dependent 3-hydroxy acid dehydrogenase YdfG
MQLCPIRSCGVFGSDRFLKYDGAPTTAMRMSGPIRTAIMSFVKHALQALSEGLRQEVKPCNIRTTVISPGAVATELPQSGTDPASAERIRKFYAEITIPADSFARAVALAISQPEDVDVNESCSGPHARSSKRLLAWAHS